MNVPEINQERKATLDSLKRIELVLEQPAISPFVKARAENTRAYLIDKIKSIDVSLEVKKQ